MSERDSSLSGHRAGGSSRFNSFSFIFAVAVLAALLLSVASPAPAGQVRRATQLTPSAGPVPHRVEIDGINLGAGEVQINSEITAELAVVPQNDGAAATQSLRPGRISYERLVITGPLPLPSDVDEWFEHITEGRSEWRDGNIVVMDRNGEEIERHEFYDAFPARLSIDLTAGTWSLHLATQRIDFRR